MNIKLVMVNKLSYYFCGSVSLSILNDEGNPLVVDLDKLSKQELIGLNRAVSTGIVDIIEGKDEFTRRYEAVKPTKKKAEKTEEVKLEEVKAVEVVEPVVEEIKVEEKATEAEVLEVIKEEVKVEETPAVEVEEVPVAKPTATRKRSTTKK